MKKMKNKKADMAIGTLIVFIAMIVVAAIAAGVIIQTATALQNKALLTGEKAKQEIGTGISTILVYGEDGSDKTLESFYMKMKLAPGSDALKFKDLLLEIDTATTSIDSVYGERIHDLAIDGDPTNIDNTTWFALDNYIVDFSGDDQVDYYAFVNETHIGFNISNSSNSFLSFVRLSFDSGSNQNISSASESSPVHFRTFNSRIEDGDGVAYGTLSLVGYSTTAGRLDTNTLMIVGEGTAFEQGAYSVDYLMKSSKYLEGYLQRGDVVKLALVAPHAIHEDEEMDVRLVPKSGTPRTISIVVPDLVNQKRVYMFS
ncbi:MAG: archaellin/type IV pilin N-terminal domain-containing protein [Candidatus Woesearchaeota archaeon]